MLKRRKTIEDYAKEITTEINNPIEKEKEIVFDKVLSTGSTLLDLAISGKRIKGGGVPGGIIAEIFGPSQAGKTAILAEIAGSCQYNGGDARFLDPEARLDSQYARIYGLEISKDNYYRPDTVKEMFSTIWDWKPENKEAINIIAADSLAALSTEMEMTDIDKMGMKRAKDFSEGFRKTARLIANNNWSIICSNQEREGTNGPVTPGGKAIPYYSSLRIRVAPEFRGAKIKKEKTVGKVKLEKIIGIRSRCTVKKTVDEPYRECNISIIFGHGIDDIRENLMYLKKVTGSTKYNCIEKEIGIIDKAIKYIEEEGLEENLRNLVIDTWEEIEDSFKIERKGKVRR